MKNFIDENDLVRNKTKHLTVHIAQLPRKE